MYHNTRGIFLKQVKYSETSIIAGIYTEAFGVQSYILRGTRGKRSKISPAILQPLSLLEMVVSHKESKDLHHIREIQSAHIYRNIPYDISKSSQVLFMNELVYKSLRESSHNQEMFDFIFDSLVFLDTNEETASSFHLAFAMHLSHFLGFFPNGFHTSKTNAFDMQEGCFIPEPDLAYKELLRGELSMQLSQLISLPVREAFLYNIPKAVRNELLDAILQYYSLHLPTAVDFKSHLVLKEVLG